MGKRNRATTGKHTIDLVIPGLSNLPLSRHGLESLARQTPSLHHFLRFSRLEANQCFDLDSILLRVLDQSQKGLPYAQASQLGLTSSLENSQAVLFRPVHLKADINNAVVFPVSIDQDNLDIIIKDLNNYFKVDCHIKALSSGYYLMQLQQVPAIQALPHYLSATGKKVTHYLQQMRSSLPWYQLFNEMQMFLHQHEINQEREARGLPTVNSLWCWGGDQWSGDRLENTHWYSDDTLISDLGQLYCARVSTLASLASEANSGAGIIIETRLLEALKGESDLDLEERLVQLEQQVFKPLLSRSNLALRIWTGAQNNYIYRPLMAARFWKRSRLLSDGQDLANESIK